MRWTSACLVSLACLLLITAPVVGDENPPRLFEVIVSPRLSPTHVDLAWKGTLGIVENRLCRSGDVLLLTDGGNLQRVVTLKVADRIEGCDPKYLRWKIQLHKRELVTINAFFTGIKERGHTETADLDIPSVLDLVGHRRAQYPGHQRDVVLFGSAIHIDRLGKGYSTTKTLPSDGHLSDPNSVFTTRGREGKLDETTVHLVHTNDFFNDLHRDRLRRFWTLYIQNQGGRLATFTVDGNVWERLTIPPLPGLPATLNESDVRPAMYSAERVSADIWGELKEKAPPTMEESGSLILGIKWDDCRDCDFDIYAGLRDSDIRVSYKHPAAHFALHVKDFLTGGTNEYERIEFTQKVDLRDLVAAVNFYSGRSRSYPAKGEVRVVFGGEVYSAPFTIQSQHGNGGREGAGQEKFWTELDLPSIVGLPQEP